RGPPGRGDQREGSPRHAPPDHREQPRRRLAQGQARGLDDLALRTRARHDRRVPAVIGYLIVATVAIASALVVAGPRHAVVRDPTFELDEVSARQVPILGALAGFAVTGVVFLVTQESNVPHPGSASFTTVGTMFVVASMGYFSSSVLFANVSHRAEDSSFDLA